MIGYNIVVNWKDMCTTFWFQSHSHAQYKFAIAFNRDESVERPYKPLHYWEANSSILAGLDIPSGGTWVGINATNGNLAFLTNCEFLPWTSITGGIEFSRGFLITSFLDLKEKITSAADFESIFKKILAKKKSLNGFNLVYTNVDANYSYYTNNYWEEDKIMPLPENESYGMSNGILTSDLYKAECNKNILKDILSCDMPLEDTKECLFQLMLNEKLAPEDKVQPAMMPKECRYELKESSIFVNLHKKDLKGGGFHSATTWTGIILVESNNHMHFYERVYDQTKLRDKPLKIYPILKKYGIQEKDLAKVAYKESHLNKIISS